MAPLVMGIVCEQSNILIGYLGKKYKETAIKYLIVKKIFIDKK